MRRGHTHAKQLGAADITNAGGHCSPTAGKPGLCLSDFSFFFTFKTICFQNDSLENYGSKIARLSYHNQIFVKGWDKRDYRRWDKRSSNRGRGEATLKLLIWCDRIIYRDASPLRRIPDNFCLTLGNCWVSPLHPPAVLAVGHTLLAYHQTLQLHHGQGDGQLFYTHVHPDADLINMQ